MRLPRSAALLAWSAMRVTAVAAAAASATTPATATPPAAAQEAPAAPYALNGTVVHVLHAGRLGRDYEIDVSLPASYGREPGRHYPVVFVTDAPYAFPLTRAIAARIGGHSHDLPEFILVGLGYARGDTPEYSRRRDYTPTAAGTPHAASDMPGRAPAFGGSAAYRRFVADEVFPFIATHYRADMSRKVFAGHSYGSLFGLDVLTSEPGMFQGYLLGSPSLWYDHHAMLDRARAWAAGADGRAPLDVYMGVGGKEIPGPGGSDDDDMVGDLRSFAGVMATAARGRPGMRLRHEVIGGEDHLTVAPILITHGLEWLLGPRSKNHG